FRHILDCEKMFAKIATRKRYPSGTVSFSLNRVHGLLCPGNAAMLELLRLYADFCCNLKRLDESATLVIVENRLLRLFR
ncbi:hypothetical protein ABE430_26545, partial [Brevibacillus agri]|uniref:hypothetical protein n=1 Tax=Brevibacillus agri TaxID=51101 RepID=UPI003D2263DB